MVSALGLDLGAKRVGVAGCDRTGLIAIGITTFEGYTFSQLVEALQALVIAREVEVLIIGLPYTLDGQIGTQARKTQKMAARLSKALKLPVEFVDERLTSFEAQELLQAELRSPSRHKAAIDRKAAALILQQWLDDRRRIAQRSPSILLTESSETGPSGL